jgi:hypothetical protein
LILNERYMRQSRAAEPRSQLKTLLERIFIVVLLGRVLDNNCVISFAKLAPLLGFGFPFLWDLDQLRRRRRLRDELRQVILHEALHISTTTLM